MSSVVSGEVVRGGEGMVMISQGEISLRRTLKQPAEIFHQYY